MFKYNFSDLRANGVLPDDVNREIEDYAATLPVPGLVDALREYRKQKWYGECSAFGITPDMGAVPILSCTIQSGIISDWENLHVQGTPLKFAAYRILFKQHHKTNSVYMGSKRDKNPKDSQPI